MPNFRKVVLKEKASRNHTGSHVIVIHTTVLRCVYFLNNSRASNVKSCKLKHNPTSIWKPVGWISEQLVLHQWLRAHYNGNGIYLDCYHGYEIQLLQMPQRQSIPLLNVDIFGSSVGGEGRLRRWKENSGEWSNVGKAGCTAERAKSKGFRGISVRRGASHSFHLLLNTLTVMSLFQNIIL